MKRKDLVKLLEQNGWWIKREGHDHTIYTTEQPTSQSLGTMK
jgi:predicted RNA binding protein YcfA (HicA-like mRNA interferase family)